MYCPKCKCEYEKGFSKCSDCGVSLVEKVPAKVKKEIAKIEVKKQREELFKILYFLVLIILAFLLIPISSTDINLLKLGGGILFCLYIIAGSVISFYIQLPLFGVVLRFVNEDRTDFDIADIVINIVVIIFAIFALFNIIS